MELTLGNFALVSYIPDPLGRFLDELRLELTPGCTPRAHVTLLPPRPLHSELKDAIRLIAEESRNLTPFQVALGDVCIFENSNVVYLAIAKGMKELCGFYDLLNRDALEYKENFPYKPHITLAQNVSAEEAARLAQLARERWAQYRGPRSFVVSELSFVQHVAPSIWTDVARVHAGVEVGVGN